MQLVYLVKSQLSVQSTRKIYVTLGHIDAYSAIKSALIIRRPAASQSRCMLVVYCQRRRSSKSFISVNGT